MGEVINAIVAVAVIVFIFRWATSGSSGASTGRSATSVLGFRPKNVTQEMVDQLHTMFPAIPPDNIRYDLLRTGNAETTSNNILERGFLDAPPPAYYTLYPETQGQAVAVAPRHPATPAAHKPVENLISRYRLEDRLDFTQTILETEAGGSAKWEATAEKREASLRERKAQMILAARQRMAAQKSDGGSSTLGQNS